MTAPTMRPPGAPPEWPHMPWPARQRWLALARRQAVDETRDPVPVDAPEVVSRPRDAKGRIIWTEAEMRAGHAAVDQHRRHPARPEPTEEQRDAGRAYDRWRGERLRRAAGTPPAPKAPERTLRGYRTSEETLALVREMAGRSVAEMCAALDRHPDTVARALRRTGRHDLALPFDRVRNAARRAAKERAAEPP